jgi:hypothetical protein
MDWTCGSSARAPALKAQSPEFKPHPNKKKEKEKTLNSSSQNPHLAIFIHCKLLYCGSYSILIKFSSLKNLP